MQIVRRNQTDGRAGKETERDRGEDEVVEVGGLERRGRFVKVCQRFLEMGCFRKMIAV